VLPRDPLDPCWAQRPNRDGENWSSSRKVSLTTGRIATDLVPA